jgi:hypothetical protein
MHALRNVYDFITGGSIASPVGVACAIVAGSLLHSYRGEAVFAILVMTFIVSSFEKPT